MYTAISLRLVPNGINQRWIDASIDYASVSGLFTTCRKVFIAARILPDMTIRYLNLSQFAATYASWQGSVQSMLSDFGNAGAIEGGAPTMQHRVASYCDATRAGYVRQAVHPTLGTQAAIDQRTDLLLTRTHPATNYSFFKSHAMVSVNGLYHMLDTDGASGVYVKGGGVSLRRSKQNQVGIWSFASVCSLSYVPITTTMVKKRLTAEMIAGTVPEPPLSTTCYIKLNQTLTNKTVLFVLGGYLMLPGNQAVSRVSDDEFSIDFSRIPMLDRYYESKGYLDLSGLGMTQTDANPSQISTVELLSDAVLTKYLTLSQSFAVVFDTPDLYMQQYFAKKTGTPGMYITFQEPKGPLMVGVGRMPEYWPTFEEDRWSLSSYDTYNRNKLYNTADPLRLTSVSNNNLPMEIEYYYDARVIELGIDIV